jgi:hypothetical protein
MNVPVSKRHAALLLLLFPEGRVPWSRHWNEGRRSERRQALDVHQAGEHCRDCLVVAKHNSSGGVLAVSATLKQLTTKASIRTVRRAVQHFSQVVLFLTHWV